MPAALHRPSPQCESVRGLGRVSSAQSEGTHRTGVRHARRERRRAASRRPRSSQPDWIQEVSVSDIVVPQLGESVVEARVARWLKKEGDRVEVGEPVVELETEKIDLEVSAERAGVITSIKRQEGEDVKIGELLAVLDESGAAGNGAGGKTAASAAASPASVAPSSVAPG